MNGKPETRPRRRTAYLITFRPTPESLALDAIRVLAHPGPRRAAHITLRGPYPATTDPVSAAELARLRSLVVGSEVTLFGVGRFHRPRGATIFLSVLSPRVASLGHTPGRQYRPHVTLYSGPDRMMADDLAQILDRLPPLSVEILDVIAVTVGVVDDPLTARAVTADPVADWCTGSGIDAGNLTSATRDERLGAIRLIAANVGR